MEVGKRLVSTIFIVGASYEYNFKAKQTYALLYGVSRLGNVLCIKDSSMDPYIIMESLSWRDSQLIKELDDGYGNRIIKKEEPMRLLDENSKPVNMTKYSVLAPHDVPVLRRFAEGRKHRVYSADILYPLRYMYSKDIGAFVKVSGTVTETAPFITLEDVSYSEGEPFTPNLKVMSFDIENSLIRDDSKIFVIGIYCKDKDKEQKTYISNDDEKELLKSFVAFINEYDPDIILGYNSDNYDWKVISDRAKDLGVSLSIGRDGSDLSIYGDKEGYKVRIRGRANLDVIKPIRRTYKPMIESLDYVSKSLGHEGKMPLDASKIDSLWESRRDEVIEYCINDAQLCYEIAFDPQLDFVNGAISMAQTAGLPLDETIFPSRSRLIDSILIREFEKAGYATPLNHFGNDDNDKQGKYEGAVVLDPPAGAHENVVVLDFKSMYPSQMLKYNICYTTFAKDETNEELLHVIHATDKDGEHIHKFYKETYKPGIMPKVMRNLMKQRQFYKDRYKKGNSKYDDIMQDSYKILMNAIYGVFGTTFYRYTSIAIASSITAKARETIISSFDTIEEMGYEVLHSHTDSIFVKIPNEPVDNLLKIAGEIVKRLSSDDLVLEIECIFSVWFNHGASTAYFGRVIWPKEDVKIRGYATRRRDSFRLQNSYLERVMHGIMYEMEMDQVFKDISNELQNAKDLWTDWRSLVITKTVNDETAYKNPDRMQNVRAARKIKDSGVEVTRNQRVSWIVTNYEHNSIRDLEPVMEGKPIPEPDMAYYIERVMRSILPISEVYGWDRTALKTGMKATTLF